MTADRRAALDALLATDAEEVMAIDTTALKRRAALVERIAALLEANELDGHWPSVASAALDLALEEAAKVAEQLNPETSLACQNMTAWCDGTDAAAAAIRALKGKPCREE